MSKYINPQKHNPKPLVDGSVSSKDVQSPKIVSPSSWIGPIIMYLLLQGLLVTFWCFLFRVVYPSLYPSYGSDVLPGPGAGMYPGR